MLSYVKMLLGCVMEEVGRHLGSCIVLSSTLSLHLLFSLSSVPCQSAATLWFWLHCYFSIHLQGAPLNSALPLDLSVVSCSE